jgi:large subunit ribosomal protein L24
MPSEGRVMVDGVAMAKKHSATSGRRTSAGTQLQQGGIIDVETFIDISNVQLVCRSCHQPTRIGSKVLDDGSKLRICRKCGAEL